MVRYIVKSGLTPLNPQRSVIADGEPSHAKLIMAMNAFFPVLFPPLICRMSIHKCIYNLIFSHTSSRALKMVISVSWSTLVLTDKSGKL